MSTKLNIINPGFSCTYDTEAEGVNRYYIEGWKHKNINIKPEPEYLDSSIVTGFNGEHDFFDEPPGVYQIIDLTSYETDVQLEINYRTGCLNKYNSHIVGTRYCFYIYEATPNSFESWGAPTSDDFNIVGSCKSYIHKVDHYYKANTYDLNSCNITLKPGYYAIGLGCDMLVYDKSDDYTIIDANGLYLVGIEAYATATPEVSYENLISHDTMHSNGSAAIRYYTVESEESDGYYFCPEDIYVEKEGAIGDICGVYLTKEMTLQQASDRYNGAYFTFNILEIPQPDSNIDKFPARLRFWHRSDLPEGSKFRVLLIDGFKQYWIDETLTTTNKWTLYDLYLDWIYSESYRLYIIPPAESYNESTPLYIGSNIEFDYYTPSSTVRLGTFESPYTYEDGVNLWECDEEGNYTAKFKFNSGKYAKKDNWICINRKYYLVKDDTGSIYCNGLYRFKNEDSITTYLRYFYPTGEMAISKEFVSIDNKYIIADANGIATFVCSVMNNLDFYIEGFDEDARVLDFLKGETFTLQATFNEMYPATLLDIEYNAEVIDIIETQKHPQTDDIGEYNTANTVKFSAKSYGYTALTLSYENFDGSITKKSIPIYVCDPSQYNEDIILEFPYAENYIVLGSTKKMVYSIKPIISCDIPVDWKSSDETIATVDAFGNVTAKALGDCTITVINYKTGKYASCIFHVVEVIDSPYKISLSHTTLDISVNSVVKVTASVLNKQLTIENIRQEVLWTSKNSSIAIVDDFGYITGVGKGTTTITCIADSRKSCVAEITVNVSGTSIELESIDLNIEEITFMIGDATAYEVLEAILIPEETTQTGLIWSSNNESLALVSQSGRVTPNLDADIEDVCRVRCLSLVNSRKYKECAVSLVKPENYVPHIYLPKKSLSAYTGEVHQIKYSISNSAYLDKTISATLKTTDNTATSNEVVINKEYIEITCSEEGSFILTVTCDYINNLHSSTLQRTVSKTYEIFIFKEDSPPIIATGLKIEDTFYNGSYILSYYAKDDTDAELNHVITIDNKSTEVYPSSHLYKGNSYHYVFGKDLAPGNHSVYITVSDSKGQSAKSNTIMFNMPNISSHKAALEDSKANSYDAYKNDIVDYLEALMSDLVVNADERKEFDIRYKRFCFAYDDIRMVLDASIEFIDQEIRNSQTEIATIAAGLASDGVSVATYSEGDYTNSNYQNITDMDYYQNQCIKELANRVLQLEALLQELMNNK